MVGWGITERCNLSCAHCYSAAVKTAGDELSRAEALAVIDALGALGTERLGWTGGEPLLRKDVEELTEYAARRYGIQSGITTNGVLLTASRAASLKRAGIGFVQISLDGSTSDRNHGIRGASNSAFRRILEAVRITCDLGLDVHMAMLLSAATLDDAHAMLALARDLGVKSLRFCGFVPWGHGRSAQILARHDLGARLDEVRDLVAELRDVERPIVLFDPAFGPLPPDYGYHECIAGMQMLYLAANGDVYPCTSLLHPRFRVGNVRNESLAELWNDPAMTAMALHPRENITGPCRDCAHFGECRGACRGIAHACTGDLDASFPHCLSR
jgi:radical SAM protein with 4Fe4S-binding SPASM domain